MIPQALATQPSSRFPVEQWRLANGLSVVVQPDPRWPLVASMMCYSAGSRCDTASRSGLAHLCEHLALDGPRDAAAGAFTARIENVGGSARAITMADRLCFSAIAPSGELPAVLRVEADRMAGPLDAEDAEAVENQRRVLLQELRERSQTRLRAAAFEQVHRQLFPDEHPYHRPPAGDPDGIRAITADDVRAFASQFSPRRAVLVLVGDLTVSAVAELVDRTFGGLPAGVERQRDACFARPVPPDRRSQRVPAAVSRPQAHVAWSIPGFGQPEWYLASLLVRALAVGRSCPLARELVERSGLAQEVHGHLLAMRDASTLVLTAVAARGVESERLEQGFASAVDRLLASGLSAPMLQRARKKALTDHYVAVHGLERRADLCASFSCYLDAPERLDGEPRRYMDPDPDAIGAFASGLRDQPARATLSLVPEAEAA